MSKAGIFGALAVVVVAGAYVGVAAYSGGAVQKEYDAAFDKMGQALPFVKIVDRKFDKGLFSSTASYGLRIGCDPQESAADGAPQSVTITFRDSIAHGPLPGFAGVGLARVDTQIELPPEAPEGLRQWIGGMKPDAIRTTIAFDGASATSVNLPAGEIKEDEVRVHWQPLRMAARMNGAHSSLSYDYEMPEFAFDVAKGDETVGFKLVNLRAQGTREMNDMLMGDGTGSGTLDNLQFTASKGLLVDLSQIKLGGSTKTENDLVGAAGSLTGVLNIKAGDKEFKFDKIELQESIKRIHAPTLQKIVLGFWAEMGNICRKTPDELAQSLQGKQAEMLLGMKDLLAHDPEYSVDKIALTWEGQEGTVSYSLAAHGITPEELQQPDPRNLMSKATIKASAKLPIAWLQKIAAEAKGGSPQEAQAQIDSILTPLVQAGYVVREGDYVSSNSEMKNGQTTINGKPFDPRVLMGAPQSHVQPGQGGEEENED